MMHLRELSQYGLPDSVVKLWTRRYPQGLLPVQRRAIATGLVGQRSDWTSPGGSQVISAPTSSGKSFCAEMAAMKALGQRQRVIMMFPLRALAEQKKAAFNRDYAGLKLKTIVVSSDHPENDRLFVTGDYNVAFAIYEKVDLLLTLNLDALSGIGLIVVDEIQTISDPFRGAVLERALTKIVASRFEPSIVGLSAVLGNRRGAATQLADWLGAETVEEFGRPVELLRGIVSEGEFRYRSCNDGLEGTEPFPRSDIDGDGLDGLIAHLKSAIGQSLIFLKSRHDTVQVAMRVAASVGWSPAGKALDKLKEDEPSYLMRSLRQVMGKGVAFHNSDLSSGQRRIVEDAFLVGEVKLIVSTTTLAMGVNLPADTVYLETVKYASGRYGSRPSLVPVTPAEFENMSGRAGRLGFGDRARRGRAVVMAANDFERDLLWRSYVDRDETGSINSALTSVPWTDWLLNLIVSGLVGKLDDAERVYRQTLCALTSGGPGPDIVGIATLLAEEEFIELGVASGELKATSLGKAAATVGLTVKQALHLARSLEIHRPETNLGWTALALGSPDWQLPPGFVNAREHAVSSAVRMLYSEYQDQVEEAAFLLPGGDFKRSISPHSAGLLKALMLLDRWSKLESVLHLEETFQIHLGQILNLADQVSHLLFGLSELLKARHRNSQLAGQLRQYCFCLKFGLPGELEELHRHLGHILTRTDLASLLRENVTSIHGLSSMTDSQLADLITGETKLERVKELLSKRRKENAMKHTGETRFAQNQGQIHAIINQPQTIEIDGSYERERYLVKIDGFPVRLTGKSFKYFVKLAAQRVRNEAGWLYKEDIEIGFNQARYLYRMKNEIYDSVQSTWPVIENNRLGYYRLNAEPAAITINAERLRLHPDYEVRELVMPSGVERPS